MKTGDRSPEVFTKVLRKALPDFLFARDRITTSTWPVEVKLLANSDRMPEVLHMSIIGNTKTTSIAFDSNRTLQIWVSKNKQSLLQQLVLRVSFLVRDDSNSELCSKLPELAHLCETVSPAENSSTIEEAISTLLAGETYRLTPNDRLMIPSLDKEKETKLVAAFMAEHSRLFRGVDPEKVMIARADEVRDWLVQLPEFSEATSINLQLMAHQIYIEVRQICLESQAAEANLRYR